MIIILDNTGLDITPTPSPTAEFISLLPAPLLLGRANSKVRPFSSVPDC